MPQQNNQETFAIKPSWKQFFTGYVLSVLAIPLFGIGLIALYFVRKKHRQIAYRISNNKITRIDSKYEHNVDLVDIEDTSIEQTWLQKKLDIGTLTLQTSASKMELVGLEEPEKLQYILSQAIQSEKKQQEQRRETKKKESEYKPGSMDRVDYLTGLWQQGLISDKEFKAERKHFE